MVNLTICGAYYDAIHNTAVPLASWHEQAPSLYLLSDYTVEGKHELLPIPQRDLDLMTGCDQNPNW